MKPMLLSVLAALFLLSATSYATTIEVPSGGDLQGAINSAQPGDVLILQAGAFYPGTFTLPAKGGTSYITIRSSALPSLPGPSQRVSPANEANMPKIVSNGPGPALKTDPGASYYNFIGIEFAPSRSDISSIDTLITLGDGTTSAQGTLSDIPHHLIFDRCYIHAYDTQSLKRGVALNSRETSILNSYISGFKLIYHPWLSLDSQQVDSQAIGGWNGPGPFHIINNYLEAAGENVMFGGTDANNILNQPSDIEIRGNLITKLQSWRPSDPSSDHWGVKNLLELKNAQKVTIEGNIFEYCWEDAQGGTAVVLTPRNQGGSNPWASVNNVVLRDNIILHVNNGIGTLSQDDERQSQVLHDVTITNNLLYDVDQTQWSISRSIAAIGGEFISFNKAGAYNLTIRHNTAYTKSTGYLFEADQGSVTRVSDLVIKDNIAHAHYVCCQEGLTGIDALNGAEPDGRWVAEGNVLVLEGFNGSPSDFTYPAGDRLISSWAEVGFVNAANSDFHLSSTSQFINSATDGTAVGANINRINGVIDGSIQVQFSAPGYSVGEGDGHATLTVMRSGDLSSSATVMYATSDPAGLMSCNTAQTGIASARCDYTTVVGTLQFAPGEASKPIFIPIVDDAYAEGNESFTVTLSNPAGALLGPTSSATVTIIDNEASTGDNPIARNDFFVRQQYLDILGREPDPPGLAGWLDVLNNCGTTYAPPCDRIEVSADFFRSPEFQDRGYFVYRFYKTLGRNPSYAEFMPDIARVSGFLSDGQLEDSKAAFVSEFMTRDEFRVKYGALTDPTAYVDALLQSVQLPNHPTRQGWINSLAAGTTTRARVLRELVESAEMYNKYYNEAFVVMEYFGYLRRDPDINYLWWIDYMNQHPNDYRTMVNGFMNSVEYFQRFGN